MTVLLEPYQEKVLIYTGVNSLIYKAFDSVKQKHIIIKILKSDYPTTAQIARFKYEYEILINLKIEGIIQVYSIEKYQNSLAIIMEDFGGVSLTSFIDIHPLEVSKFLELAIPITNILGEIHGKNVIHKDINPSNIIYNANTHLIKIIDFGISSPLPKETPEVCSPVVLEGTLPYISPEQTGRMNRTIDYRTDYYSLGVTFYQMLTGVLPFQTDDPMTLVHSHIAKLPTPPHEINPDIPVALSNIIMKLMSKRAEDRYQSAFGLKEDLQRCADQLAAGNPIEDFVLGQKDISLHFQIPEKLYGREQEIELLLQNFDKVASGQSQLLLVAGYSGIGKSALIHEVHKPIVEKRGYFISGKFDQYKRDIPYSAFIQAFHELIHQILTEGPQSIVKWKSAFENALKDMVNVVTEVIPDLELIVGPQPELAHLGPVETQNRFNMIFQTFIQVIATSEHPLTIFLDDLQWVDVPSLNLIELIFLGQRVKNFFLIGAYRVNEVTSSHVLMMTLTDLKIANVPYDTLALPPLDIEHVNQILVDTLRREEDVIAPLTQLCYEKTQGNPFFLIQLLLSLHKKGLFEYSIKNGRWEWEIDNIRSIEISPNVVDLMTAKIKKLSAGTQNILTIAACIGNFFDTKTLSHVYAQSPQESAAQLEEALQEGLIIPENNAYKYYLDQTDIVIPYRFLHDRVQQAAYSLIPKEQKIQLHYQIGHMLLENTPKEKIAEKVFEIVTHLNRSSALIKDDNERINLVKLNFIAGKRAKDSSAFRSAADYLELAKNLLPSTAWESLFSLTFDINKEYALCLYISREIEPAEVLFKEILSQAKTPLDHAEIARLLSMVYTTTRQPEKALDIGISALNTLGINITKHPSKISILKEILLSKWNLGRRKIADLLDAPIITDETIKMQLDLLMDIVPSAYTQGNQDLVALISLNQVNIVLKNGILPAAASAFLTFAFINEMILGDLKGGYEFAKLSLAISERYPDIRSKSRIYFLYPSIIHHWNHHRKTLYEYYKKSIEYGIESGDFLYMSNSCNRAKIFDPTINCETMLAEGDKYLSIIQQTKFQDSWNRSKVEFQFFASLLGKTKDVYSLSDDSFDENECLAQMIKGNAHGGEAVYYQCKYLLHLIHGDYTNSLEYLKERDRPEIRNAVFGQCYHPDNVFYGSIIYSLLYSEFDSKEQKKIWGRLKSDHKQMKKWADYCPVNFLHYQLIMEAEMARLSGNNELAGQLYEKGINAAKENEFLLTEALSNELAARFYSNQKMIKSEKVYITDAYYCYSRWGATTKMRQLEDKYPEYLKNDVPGYVSHTIMLGQTTQGTSHNIASDVLDYTSAMKASRALSGEIVLSTLIKKMMQIVIENAGAEKGFLILKKGEDYFIEAEVSSGKEELKILQHIAIENLPKTILNYVISTNETVVLRDAAHEGSFTNDPYIQKLEPKSVLCLPLVHQNVLRGLLYLENNLTPDAFTQNRVDLLNLICSQATISIENAQFYAELEEKVEERTKELKQTQNQMIYQEKMASLGSLTAGIAHELMNPLNFVVNFSQISKSDVDDLIAEINEGTKEKKLEIVNELKDSFAAIEGHGLRASSIIKKMLSHSHIASNQKEKTDINALLEQAFDLAYQSYLIKNPTFTLTPQKSLDKNLPQIDVFLGDLSQVFINIFDNSFYAMSEKLKSNPHDYTPYLELKTSLEGKNIKIVVKDNGTGIPKEIIDKVFNPFFTTKPTGSGTGLGLSIAYETIASQHNGTIVVLSKPNIETEFVITLPYTRWEKNK